MISVEDGSECVPFGRALVSSHPQGVTGCRGSDEVVEVGVQGVSFLGDEEGGGGAVGDVEPPQGGAVHQ